MNKPLISVIIPAYNCEDTIATAISSIQNQTYPNLEIIVVDDASTDNTKNIVKEIMKVDPRIRLIDSQNDPNKYDPILKRNINAGWSARNSGFKIAKGELITFQDADDASLKNRIDIQYKLLNKYKASHITLDWFDFDQKYLGREINEKIFDNKLEKEMVGPAQLTKLASQTKGIIAKISTSLNSLIPFYWKRKRFINKLFWSSLAPYPGTGNSPLFKISIIDKVQFRPLKYRVWPSFMGRGADRDFNFAVAETFKNSYVFFIPAYMWRINKINEKYGNNIEKYLK
jgi:glycosyltransferase involved in cell wall biosynthesis